MATINSSTKHKVSSTSISSSTATPSTGTKKNSTSGSLVPPTSGTTGGGGGSSRRGATAPTLKCATQVSVLDKLVLEAQQQQQQQQKNQEQNHDQSIVTIVTDMYRRCLGEHTTFQLNKPHTASTTRDRCGAAADLAYITNKHLGLPYVLCSPCNILHELQRTLFPDGIDTLTTRGGGNGGGIDGTDTNSITGTTATPDGIVDNNTNDAVDPGTILSTIKPSMSALSLSSLVDEGHGGGGDASATMDSIPSERGRTVPPNAREGCLLFIRALIEAIGKPTEPYFVGAFLAAAIDECASSSSAVREAAEDTCTALISISNPYSFRSIIAPILLQSLQCPEWRIKSIALDKLTQCTTISTVHKQQVYNSIPTLVPVVTNQVWDTKGQVSKAARSALTAICNTNTNPDIQSTIPALVNALCKPSDTNKAVTELMGTTFVVPVDAAVLTILCPLLARALKEKIAIHKRAACIVINNMSKLVNKPSSIAPFGNLLIPELQRVVRNVQFEEIRDEALRALASLTKALGEHFNMTTTAAATTTTSSQQQQIQQAEGGGVEHESNNLSQATMPSTLVPSIVDTTSSIAAAAAPISSSLSLDNSNNNKQKQQQSLLQQKKTEEHVEHGNDTNATVVTSAIVDELLRENELVRQEQERIRVAREIEAAKLEEIRIQEEEERRRFKEAMDAQRELDKIAADEYRTKRAAEELVREKQRLSTKSSTGKCQGCGLKKCKKTCMFFTK